MARLLITGVTGMLGSKLFEVAREQGIDVYGTTRRPLDETAFPPDLFPRERIVTLAALDKTTIDAMLDLVGEDKILWGSDFPHAESTWPKSREFLDRIFAGTPEADLRKITSENAVKLFGFALS